MHFLQWEIPGGLNKRQVEQNFILNLNPLIKHNLFFSTKIISFVSNILNKLFCGKTPGSEKQQIKQKIKVPKYNIDSIINNIIL